MIAESEACPTRVKSRNGEKVIALHNFALRDIESGEPDNWVKGRKPHIIPVQAIVFSLLFAICSKIVLNIPCFWIPRQLSSAKYEDIRDLLMGIGQATFWISSLISTLVSSGLINQLLKRSWANVRTLLVVIVIATYFGLIVFMVGKDLRIAGGLVYWAQTATIASWSSLVLLCLTILLGDEVQGKLGRVTGIRTWWRMTREEEKEAKLGREGVARCAASCTAVDCRWKDGTV